MRTPPSSPHALPLPDDERTRKILQRYASACAQRSIWEAHWQECCDFALPLSAGFTQRLVPGERRVDRLFDGTAPDAVEQLAASLLASLTPPWSRWFGLNPGPDLKPEERQTAAPLLEKITTAAHNHLDRSNFAVEMHQCLLDLVTCGTASLLVEESAPGEISCLRFTAAPLSEVVLEEGLEGRLNVTFRRTALTLEQFQQRFGAEALPESALKAALKADDPNLRLSVVEAVIPDGPAYRYMALLASENVAGVGVDDRPRLLTEGRFGQSPFINFRWMKAPGEIYGRSPVMKALPDIKTVNKVVELVLKNASIAVTGMWQADDDGVLNPATIRLTPGTIIPKAVGSAGLTPLSNPARFDVSQLMLDDLRRRIRHALLIDQLGPVAGSRMTATEVVTRSAEMARLLGATYGRLQSELLTPLILRILAILRRRGECPDIAVDGRLIEIQHRSPLAQAQAQRDVEATLHWLETAAGLGPEALAIIDAPAAARWLGNAFGAPPTLFRPTPPVTPN
ncbi:Phage tail protein [Azospirillaceae bacterium]